MARSPYFPHSCDALPGPSAPADERVLPGAELRAAEPALTARGGGGEGRRAGFRPHQRGGMRLSPASFRSSRGGAPGGRAGGVGRAGHSAPPLLAGRRRRRGVPRCLPPASFWPRAGRAGDCVLGWSSIWRVIITAAVCRQARRQSWLRDAEERNLRGTRGCARRGVGWWRCDALRVKGRPHHASSPTTPTGTEEEGPSEEDGFVFGHVVVMVSRPPSRRDRCFAVG